MFERGSGILWHITSLPSPYGIGDLGPQARHFVDALAGAGQKYWQVLPLNPTCFASGDSPYYSASAFAGNPLLISPDDLLDDGLVGRKAMGTLPAFSRHIVDFQSVRAYKTRVLDAAYDAFRNRGRPEDYERFCSDQAFWLDDYALFMVIGRDQKTYDWAAWPVDLRDRHPASLDGARQRFAAGIEREKYFQYLFYRQWERLKACCARQRVSVIGDIPIYVSFESADLWAHPGYFKLGGSCRPVRVSGVPPDYFSEKGQLWNNPVYDWAAIRDSGYEWWLKRMANALRLFDIVRIDHFRGLVQYWEVAAGETTAINGRWQDVPTGELLDAMKAAFPGLPVIAEDLGIITPDVREVMARYGLPGMKVLLFAFGEDNPDHPYLPYNYERNCVVYTGTHDNNTARGWFENEALPQDRERLARHVGRNLSAADVPWELARLALASVADVAIVPAQDLLSLDESARMNRPGEAKGNWLWRMTPEQFERLPLDRLGEMSAAYGRVRSRESAG